MQDPSARPARGRLAVAAAVATALATYLPGLGAIHAPSIGDEDLYLQIARTTAASGHALPLLSDQGITDTKPPLLFWQGILATSGGRAWELARLRLPVVLLSFAAAAAAGLLAWRITGDAAAAALAALAFLGFRSTIQHGRAFLTNAGETLFLFLPLLLLHGRARTGARLGAVAGLSLGLAALYKSVLVVVPGTLALALVLLSRERWRPRDAVARHGGFLLAAAAVGVATFGLWPLLDPRPDLVWSQFVVGENVGKLGVRGWLAGLVSGPYPIWRIWLGDVANAGLWALPVLALLADLWRRRRALEPPERELWLYVLAFVAVYSLPSQRQENYLLPTCPALAVLLALRWRALPAAALRATLAVLALVAAAAVALVARLDAELGPRLFSPAASALPALLAAAALAGALSTRVARAAFPHLALAALLAAAPILAAFSPPYPAGALDAVRGRDVLVPSRFRAGEERQRFRLPGANVRAYACPPSPATCPPPPATSAAVLTLDVGASVPEGWAPLAETLAFRQRHSPAQVARLLRGDLSLLAERQVLARPASTPAEVAADRDAPRP